MNIPNRITLLRIALLPIFLAVVLIEAIPYRQFIGAVIFLVCALTDLYDGYYARKYHMVTDLGKFLDPIADKLIVAAALVVLLQWGRVGPISVIVILSREFIVSAFRTVAANNGLVISAGPLGKIKTVLQDVAIVMLLIDNWPFSYIGLPLAQLVMLAAVVMTLWSGIDYIVRNWHVVSGQGKEG